MTRLLGPDISRRAVTQTVGATTYDFSGRTATAYLDQALTQLAPIATYDANNPTVVGALIANSQITLSAQNSRLPLFWFPDGVDTLWLSINTLPHVWMVTADVDARLDADFSILAPRRKPSASGPTDTVLLSRFDAGHGWTYLQGTGVGVDDTTVVGPFATQSVKLTASATGSTTGIEKAGLTVDLTTTNLVFWIKWDTLLTNPAITVYAGDSTLANSYTWNKYREQTDSYNAMNGWTAYEVFVSEPGAASIGTPNPAAITRIRIRAELGSGTIWVGGIGTRVPSATYPNGVITVGFDDSLASTYDLARPIVAKYNFPAVSYAIADALGTTGFMSLVQAQDLAQTCGWEIAGHAFTQVAHNARFTTLTPAQLVTEFRNLKSWMLHNGFISDAWASPGGQSNTTLWLTARSFFGLHRGVSNGFPQQSAKPVYPPHIKAPSFDTTANPVSTLQTYIGQVKTAKAWGNITFHAVTTIASAAGSVSTTDFDTILAYIQSQGVPVRTVDQVLRGV